MLRYILVSCIYILTFNVEAQSNTNWFQYDSDKQQFSITGKAIHPAAFFKQIILHSGVEIHYEKYLSDGLNLDFEGSDINEIFNFIDTNFSTLKAFIKNNEDNEILTTLTILPKGNFQSSNLVLALNPIREAVAHKQQTTPLNAQEVYITRTQKMDLKIQQNLERMASKEIEHKEKQRQKRNIKKENTSSEKNALIKEFRELKVSNPEIYQRKIEIMSWKYPDLKDAIESNH
jgi:hypothetical protein